ncbi:MAG: 1-acyl-sn-glycerol-3-phosphate acyltransferase [Candidatus Omnitrophica bacterium]|nr:1-acyl-sn-glycerol-3-phosphate acyltransferase [Candidatus Omnitrophota bacterium]
MAYRISRFLLEVFARVLFKVRFFGRENLPNAPYVVVSNHASLLDPPLVGAACKKDNINFMAKNELFTAPILGVWTRSVGCIPVKRGANSVQSLKEAIKRINSGYAVAIFPEGTRSEDGNLQKAKRGIGFLVSKAKVRVVPIYIEGSAKAMPRVGPMKYGMPVNVFIGKTIQPEEFIIKTDEGKDDYSAIANLVMSRIAGLKK